MTYIRLSASTIELLFSILLFSISIITFSQVFSVSLLGVCVASCLIHLTFDVVNKSGKIFFFQTILSCLEPFPPKGIVMNLRTIWFKGPYGLVHLTVTLILILRGGGGYKSALAPIYLYLIIYRAMFVCIKDRTCLI